MTGPIILLQALCCLSHRAWVQMRSSVNRTPIQVTIVPEQITNICPFWSQDICSVVRLLQTLVQGSLTGVVPVRLW